jgi:uncharacterized membrane protein YfcA
MTCEVCRSNNKTALNTIFLFQNRFAYFAIKTNESDMDYINLGIALLAALLAGFINSVAGGGTLITFPVLVALGVPPITANITNTVALSPGLFGGVYAQRHLLHSQKRMLFRLLPVGILGGTIGGFILLNSDEKSFNLLVPFLILMATFLLAVQNPVKKWVASQISQERKLKPYYTGLIVVVFFAAIYGGYFGAGLGVILLATLGVFLKDKLTHLNALKQAISLSVNLTAAIYFIFSGQIIWWYAVTMACGALVGGYVGGHFTNKLNPEIFKWIVVGIGTCVGIVYLIKIF